MKKISFAILLLTIILSPFQSLSQNFTWVKSTGGTTGELGETSVITDIQGNIITVGSFKGTVDFDPGSGSSNLTSTANSYDIFVQKLTVNGVFIWAKQFGGAYPDNATAVDVGKTGNIYFTGKISYSTPSTSSEVSVSKLDASGNAIWTKSLSTAFAGTNDTGKDIKIDSLENVYVTGEFDYKLSFDAFNITPSRSSEIFIAKLNASGIGVWAKTLRCNKQYNYNNAHSIGLDSLYNVYIAGNYNGIIDFDPGASVHNDTSVSLSTSSPFNSFILKLNNAGNYIWSKSLHSGKNEGSTLNSMYVTKSGDVIATGTFTDSIDIDPSSSNFYLAVNNSFTSFSNWGENGFIVKLNTAGNFIFGKQLYDFINFYSNANPNKIIVDKSNNIVIVGYFKDTVDFDYSNNTPYLISYNLKNSPTYTSYDLFILKLNPLGDFSSVKQLRSNNANSYLSGGIFADIIADNIGNLYITCNYKGSVDFDPSSSTYNLSSQSTSGKDCFLLKLDNSPFTSIAEQMIEKPTSVVYPNPTNNGIITIENQENISNVYITDVLGQLIYKQQINQHKSEIDISFLPNGLYLLDVVLETKEVKTIKIIKQ